MGRCTYFTRGGWVVVVVVVGGVVQGDKVRGEILPPCTNILPQNLHLCSCSGTILHSVNSFTKNPTLIVIPINNKKYYCIPIL